MDTDLSVRERSDERDEVAVGERQAGPAPQDDLNPLGHLTDVRGPRRDVDLAQALDELCPSCSVGSVVERVDEADATCQREIERDCGRRLPVEGRVEQELVADVGSCSARSGRQPYQPQLGSEGRDAGTKGWMVMERGIGNVVELSPAGDRLGQLIAKPHPNQCGEVGKHRAEQLFGLFEASGVCGPCMSGKVHGHTPIDITELKLGARDTGNGGPIGPGSRRDPSAVSEPAKHENPFAEFVTELADGQRWRLLGAEGWEDFIKRLAGLVAQMEPHRRQALVMLLFALVDRQLSPEDAKAWLDTHDTDSDDGLLEMLDWLRQFRPRPGEVLPGGVDPDGDE